MLLDFMTALDDVRTLSPVDDIARGLWRAGRRQSRRGWRRVLAGCRSRRVLILA